MARRPIAAASRAAALLVVCTLLPAGCTSADRHPSAGSGGSPGSSATTTGSTAGRLPVGSSSTPSPVPLGSTTVDDPPLTSVLAASSSIGTRTAADPTGLEPVPDPAALLRRQHDSGFAPLMATLGAQLQSGARDNFLAASGAGSPIRRPWASLPSCSRRPTTIPPARPMPSGPSPEPSFSAFVLRMTTTDHWPEFPTPSE